MKLGDIFNRTGDKIGEIHSERSSSDLGCLVIILIPIIIICGIIVWPAIFTIEPSDEEAFMPFMFLGVILATDILVTLIGIWLTKDRFESFGDIFWGCLIFSTLISAIILLILFHILDEEFTFFGVLAIFIVPFFVQLLPSLVMAIIIKAFSEFGFK